MNKKWEIYQTNEEKVEKLQEKYKLNRLLLKPPYGIEFQKLEINKKRSENIISWITQFENYAELQLKVNEIMSDLSFGKKADSFEPAFFMLLTFMLMLSDFLISDR